MRSPSECPLGRRIWHLETWPSLFTTMTRSVCSVGKRSETASSSAGRSRIAVVNTPGVAGIPLIFTSGSARVSFRNTRGILIPKSLPGKEASVPSRARIGWIGIRSFFPTLRHSVRPVSTSIALRSGSVSSTKRTTVPGMMVLPGTLSPDSQLNLCRSFWGEITKYSKAGAEVGAAPACRMTARIAKAITIIVSTYT